MFILTIARNSRGFTLGDITVCSVPIFFTQDTERFYSKWTNPRTGITHTTMKGYYKFYTIEQDGVDTPKALTIQRLTKEFIDYSHTEMYDVIRTLGRTR